MLFSLLHHIELLEGADLNEASQSIKEIKELIDASGNRGQLELEIIYSSNDNNFLVRPLFDVPPTAKRLIPTTLLLSGDMGLYLIRRFEKIWGLQEAEFFNWLRMW